LTKLTGSKTEHREAEGGGDEGTSQAKNMKRQ
jgi:hypothetical protein